LYLKVDVMFATGDGVEIMGQPGDPNRGKYGDTGIKPVTQPAIKNAPGRDVEPRFGVRLNSGDWCIASRSNNCATCRDSFEQEP
jgi:hypothetical protein